MPARNKYCVFKGTGLNLGVRGLRTDRATNGKQQQWNGVLYSHVRVSRGLVAQRRTSVAAPPLAV